MIWVQKKSKWFYVSFLNVRGASYGYPASRMGVGRKTIEYGSIFHRMGNEASRLRLILEPFVDVCS